MSLSKFITFKYKVKDKTNTELDKLSTDITTIFYFLNFANVNGKLAAKYILPNLKIIYIVEKYIIIEDITNKRIGLYVLDLFGGSLTKLDISSIVTDKGELSLYDSFGDVWNRRWNTLSKVAYTPAADEYEFLFKFVDNCKKGRVDYWLRYLKVYVSTILKKRIHESI